MNSKTYTQKAQTTDYLSICSLLESVHLPVEGVKEHLSNFVALKKDGRLIGTVGLEVYNTKALLRSLAIAKEFQGQGYGIQLYRTVLKMARKQGVSEIYLLTETAEDFFSRQGFNMISRDLVDAAVKESVEFQSVCPETASCMQLRL